MAVERVVKKKQGIRRASRVVGVVMGTVCCGLAQAEGRCA